MRQSIREYIRASEKLMELKDLSEEEQEAITKVLDQLSVMFPNEGDDAAD